MKLKKTTTLSASSYSLQYEEVSDEMEYGYPKYRLIVSCCRISYNNRIWSITEWFTESKYRHLGYGKLVIRECFLDMLEREEKPSELRYNWDGHNDYVRDWLIENFDAVEINQSAGITIFSLDIDKFFNYFILENPVSVP